MRPERVRVVPVGAAEPETGSRLEGTLAQVVFLGMYTQLHVDTSLGRVVCHRLADELDEAPAVGSRVGVCWDADQSYLLTV